MKEKSKSEVSIIGGADGPNKYFLSWQNTEKSL